MTTLEVFARSLKQVREARGFAQQEIADLLGVSQPAYHKIESGKTNVDLLTALTLAKFFGLKLDNLPVRFRVVR